MAHAIQTESRAVLGVAVSPHQFRHLSAECYLLENPDALYTISQHLVHRDPIRRGPTTPGPSSAKRPAVIRSRFCKIARKPKSGSGAAGGGSIRRLTCRRTCCEPPPLSQAWTGPSRPAALARCAVSDELSIGIAASTKLEPGAAVLSSKGTASGFPSWRVTGSLTRRNLPMPAALPSALKRS